MKNNSLLRRTRKKHKYSAEQVAEILGISVSFYYNVENGQRGLTNEMAVRLANLYGVSVDSILGIEPVKDQIHFTEDEINEVLSDLKAAMNEAVSKGLLSEQEKIDFFKKSYKEFEFFMYQKKNEK